MLNKILVKNISENLTGEHGQNLLDHAKNLLQMHIKLLQAQFKKTAEATADLIVIKIANRISKVSKNLQQNKSETVTNEDDKEMPKERYVSPEERQKNIDNLRLI